MVIITNSSPDGAHDPADDEVKGEAGEASTPPPQQDKQPQEPRAEPVSEEGEESASPTEGDLTVSYGHDPAPGGGKAPTLCPYMVITAL